MLKHKISFSILLIFFAQLLTAQSSPFDSVNLLLQQRVYFDFGKHDITTESDNILRNILDSCRTYSNAQLHIEAHTDHVGSDENNLILSRKRSESVKTFFTQNGISPDKISTSVFGEANPVADNTSDDGRQENRRAAISLFIKKEMTLLKGKVVDKKTGDGIQANVIFHTKNFKDSIRASADGSFEKAVEVNTILGVDIYKKDYFFETQMLKAKPKNTVILSIPLLPITVGEKVAIKNLYFVGGQAVLLKKSKPELPKVLKFMQLNPKIKIKIAGHINAPGRRMDQLQQWEQELSTNRAKLVYDFLLDNKIEEERVTYKGYGNAQMVFPFATSEIQQAKNRRVEIIILETGGVISAN